MNLQKIKDSQLSGKFVVGNLNDYLNIINKTNTYENSKLSIEDFSQLEEEYPGEILSYKITTYVDDKAIESFEINGIQYLNIYIV